jgi:hypothetical protein
MELDQENNLFVLDEQDQEVLGEPKVEREIPVDQASFILDRAEIQRERNLDVDLSLFPHGAAQNAEIAGMYKRSEALRSIIKTVRPHLPSVTDGAEAFLDELKDK